MDRLSAASAAAIIVASAAIIAAAAVVVTITVVSAAAEEKDKNDDPPAAVVIVSEHEISPRKINLYRINRFLFSGMLYDMKTFRRWLQKSRRNDWRIL